jgi:PAS domain S-box-containing protein
MFDFLTHLFDTTGFPDRWHCGDWTLEHGWLHILSDLAVWSAYFAIPCILVYFVLRRRDVPYPTIFWLFGAFILACGTTHLMEAIIFWHPVYRLAGLIKLLTAIVSWATVGALVPIIPRALALRGPEDLAREIAARRIAEDALQRANAELERRVQARTAELAQANTWLRFERERLRVTLASIGDAVLVTDNEGQVTFLNSVAQNLTGWKEEEANGQPLETVFRIINEQTREVAENPAVRALREGAVVGLANHTILIAKDGVEHAIDDSAAPIRHEDGRVAGVVLVFRDVTEQRQADRSARFLASIVESTDDAIIGKDINGIITSWNQGAERIFGYSATEVIGRSIAVLAPPDRADDMPGILARIKRGERVEHFDTVRRAKNGRFVPIALTVSPIKNEDGEIVGASKIARDISDRKKAEEALREEKERLHATLTGIGDAVIVTDAQSRITIMNPVAQALTGWKEQATGRPLGEVFRIINEQTREPVENPVHMVMCKGGIVGLANHTLLVAKDGRQIPIDDSGAPVRNAEGQIIAVVLIFRDMTERRQAEASLRASEALLAAELEDVSRLHALSIRLLPADNLSTALDDLLDNAILASRADFGNIQLYNPQVGALEIVAQRGFRKDFLDYFRQVRVTEGSACAQAMQSGKRIIIEDVALDPAYAPHRPVAAAAGYRAVQSTPLKNRAGAVLGMLSTHFRTQHRPSERDERLLDLHARHAADLIERIRFEQALKDADRRKDEFLATLAHELRNPLAPILNAVELLERSDGNATVTELARNIMRRQLDHMVRLVDDLLDMSRISQGKIQLRRQRVELAMVVHSAVEAVRPLAEAQALELSVTLPPDPIVLHGDSTRLAQVISNLLDNAAKYTEKGGHVWLTVEKHGTEVLVSVKDTGIGIAPENLSHVFEMFSQVAPALERPQGGLGIGLSLVRALVELHGGKVEARSRGLGKGSEFIVRLPVLDMPAVDRAQGKAKENETPSGCKRRILAVDDSRDAANSLALMLQQMGHETRTAYDGLEAIQAAEAFRPEVILLDIGLPKINGYESARQIRQQPWGKGIALIALTGWGQDEDIRRAMDAGFDHHLTKPVEAAALEKLLALNQPTLQGV